LVAASIAAALVALVPGGSNKLATVGRLNLGAEQQRGRDLFAQVCTRCHTLAAVDSVPRVGFSADLDALMSRAAGSDRRLFVLNAIVGGGPGMPAKLFVGKDAQDVADFVSAVAGRDLSTGTASTAVLPPREVELNKIALNSSDPASRSTGSAYVFSEGSKYMLTLQLKHLPPSNGFSYAVWLVGSDSRLVGELGPVVSDEHLQAEARLPADASNYHTLLLTRETSERPTQPGALVLSGPFSLAEPIQAIGLVSLSLKGEEPVYVCLLGDNGQKLIPGITLQAGERTPTYHAKGFAITLGNGPVTMFVNGKARIVEPFNQATGYSITKTRGIQPLSARQMPTCR
jgi:mono/diheme cytochrome c family protein